MQKDTKQADHGETSTVDTKRTLENILDEYKILSIRLFDQAGVVTESDGESASLFSKQAELLDEQQVLLIEAQSIELEDDKDIVTLLQLWKSEEVFNDEVTPSQNLVLRVQDHFEHVAA